MNIAELRAATPGCQHRNHLNNAGAALLSAQTIAAMTHQLQLETQIGGYEAAEAAADKIDDTYRALGELLGASAQEVALFDNSTHAWNAAFYSVPLAEGDRILTGRNEYGSSVLAYLQIAARTGAEVVVVPDDESGQIDLDALAGLVDERTKLIGLTWVPTAGGLVNPAAEVGRIARDADTLFLLDATQAVGQFPIDVAALGCDMLTGTGRKFLRGPRGTGFLYAGPRAIDRLEPFVAEIRSATWDGDRSFTWADGARRFETWENSYVNVVGLGVAVRQALDLGLAEIGTRCELSRRTAAQRPGRHAWRDHPRPRPRTVRDRDGAGLGHRQRGCRRRACGARYQRQHDGVRSQPVRHPRCASAGAPFAALLQHRRRDRPGDRSRRGTGPLARRHARVTRLGSRTISDSAQLTTDSTIAAQIAVHQKSLM